MLLLLENSSHFQTSKQEYFPVDLLPDLILVSTVVLGGVGVL